MYKRYARYGTTEVANSTRVAEYAKNGIAPPGLSVDDCSDCGDLATVLGDGDYNSPILDSAPWMDLATPDSADFAGVMILDMTGVEGSTVTASVTDRLGDGGIIGGRRARPRTVQVSALAIARTPAGLDAGLSWLGAALHPPCSGGDCGGDTLHLFSSCPPICAGVADPAAAPVTTVYTDDDLGFGTYPYPYPLPGFSEGGFGEGLFGDPFIRGDAPTVILGPLRPGVCDPVEMEWAVSSVSGEVIVLPGMADPAGVPVVVGEMVTVDETPVIVSLEEPQSAGYPDSWRPVLIVPAGQPMLVTTLTVTQRPALSIEECVADYRRTLRNVVTIEGPTVVEEFAVGDDGESVMCKVEWTWVAGSPWVYANPTPLLTSVDARGTEPGTYTAPGVQLLDAAPVTAAATECLLPVPSLLSCADNACCTPLLAPPSAPVLLNDCLMAPEDYTRRAFQVPPTVTPAGLGVLSWTFINDENPKMGVRVRIWEDPDPDVGVTDECGWVQEFTIDYLAGGQSLIIDGAGETVTALCGLDVLNQPIIVDSIRNVSGGYGGPFQFAPIGCGRRYHIAVDVPDTYTETCPSGYTSGDSQGDLVWSVTLTRRS